METEKEKCRHPRKILGRREPCGCTCWYCPDCKHIILILWKEISEGEEPCCELANELLV